MQFQNTFFIIILQFLYILWVSGTDYCAVNPNHLLCNAEKPDNFDENIYYFPKTDLERETLLAQVNEIRDEIAGGTYTRHSLLLPPAAGMMQLKWCEDCEKAAWNVLKECSINYQNGYRPCCNCMKTGTMTIKGLAMTGGIGKMEGDPPKVNLDSLTDALRKDQDNEFNSSCLQNLGVVDERNCPSFDPLYELGTDTFTQVACLFIQCRENPLSNTFACYFGGQPNDTLVYKQGKSCSACPQNSSCSTKFKNLCECSSSLSCIEAAELNSSCEENQNNSEALDIEEINPEDRKKSQIINALQARKASKVIEETFRKTYAFVDIKNDSTSTSQEHPDVDPRVLELTDNDGSKSEDNFASKSQKDFNTVPRNMGNIPRDEKKLSDNSKPQSQNPVINSRNLENYLMNDKKGKENLKPRTQYPEIDSRNLEDIPKDDKNLYGNSKLQSQEDLVIGLQNLENPMDDKKSKENPKPQTQYPDLDPRNLRDIPKDDGILYYSSKLQPQGDLVIYSRKLVDMPQDDKPNGNSNPQPQDEPEIYPKEIVEKPKDNKESNGNSKPEPPKNFDFGSEDLNENNKDDSNSNDDSKLQPPENSNIDSRSVDKLFNDNMYKPLSSVQKLQEAPPLLESIFEEPKFERNLKIPIPRPRLPSDMLVEGSGINKQFNLPPLMLDQIPFTKPSPPQKSIRKSFESSYSKGHTNIMIDYNIGYKRCYYLIGLVLLLV